jgi:hypothetical protein
MSSRQIISITEVLKVYAPSTSMTEHVKNGITIIADRMPKGKISINDVSLSLDGLPSELKYLHLVGFHVDTLVGCPENVKTLIVGFAGLKSLIGCPEGCESLTVSNNQLTNLDHLSHSVKFLGLAFNRLDNACLLQLPRQDYDMVDLSSNPITEISNINLKLPSAKAIGMRNLPLQKLHMLGFMVIKNLHSISLSVTVPQKLVQSARAVSILTKIIKAHGDLFDLQEALMDAGLEEFAYL